MRSILEDTPLDHAPTGRTPAGIALLLWACDPTEPHRLAAPFAQAAAAAALGIPVEIHFTGRSVLLLQPGVAEILRPSPFDPKTVLESMRETVDRGAVLVACTDALQAHGMNPRSLIPECSRRGGPALFMGRLCDPDWRTLVF